ncbi:hypothetical protein V1L54_26910 [Streptomyces sp. TRM 70361]|uniref:hypothetical protein n=1 Tax=Streptomyces sp. TRM 70361 TaxID=3116553 RepID=UPI002E7B158A|nr:hypothetical protein [Streptomyces sp. TRM 70361]MEE1942996.1 hypothetical protein [Streptomyces sp. TRM 70361]
MDETPSRPGEPADRSGRWPARFAAAAEQYTAAVVADPFGRVAWLDVYGQSAGLREPGRQRAWATATSTPPAC